MFENPVVIRTFGVFQYLPVADGGDFTKSRGLLINKHVHVKRKHSTVSS